MSIEALRIASLLALAGWAAVSDLRVREIPDAAPLGLLALAVGGLGLGVGPDPGSAALGLGIGMAIAVAGFRLGAIGGGDAKLIAALGAALGPFAFFVALAGATCAGGVGAAWASHRGEDEIPYAPALALGTALALAGGDRLAAWIATPPLLGTLAFAGTAVMAFALRRMLLARRAVRRLHADDPVPAGAPRSVTSGRAASRGERWIALGLGAAAAVAAWSLGAKPAVASGAGAVGGVACHLVFERRRERATLLAETQLAQAIALASSALRAGASPNDAFERAARESRPPLAPILEATSRRLRLGEDPERVLGAFAARVPLASARLFATAVAVQWSAGGSFERALTGVGRSIRDRVETARRIDTQTASVRASLVSIVLANVAIAALGWSANPGSIAQLVGSPVGSAMLAMTLWLQALALVWIARLARRVR